MRYYDEMPYENGWNFGNIGGCTESILSSRGKKIEEILTA